MAAASADLVGLALQSATITVARLRGQEAHVGRIVRGAWADLLPVEGDPSRGLGCCPNLGGASG